MSLPGRCLRKAAEHHALNAARRGRDFRQHRADRDAGGAISRKAVDAGGDRRERQRRQPVLGRKHERRAIAGRQQVVFAACAAAPHRADGVDHVSCRQPVAAGDLGGAGVERVALVELERLAGDPENWPIVNRRFLANVRKQFLTWRTLEKEQRQRYLDEVQEFEVIEDRPAPVVLLDPRRVAGQERRRELEDPRVGVLVVDVDLGGVLAEQVAHGAQAEVQVSPFVRSTQALALGLVVVALGLLASRRSLELQAMVDLGVPPGERVLLSVLELLPLALLALPTGLALAWADVAVFGPPGRPQVEDTVDVVVRTSLLALAGVLAVASLISVWAAWRHERRATGLGTPRRNRSVAWRVGVLVAAVMLLLGLVVLFFVIRPLVRRVITPEGAQTPFAAAPATMPAVTADAATAAAAAGMTLPGVNGSITSTGGPNVSIVGGDEAVAISNRTSAMIDIAKVQGQVHAQSVQKVGELADKNPHEAVSIIRNWLHEDAA